MIYILEHQKTTRFLYENVIEKLTLLSDIQFYILLPILAHSKETSLHTDTQSQFLDYNLYKWYHVKAP